MVVASIILGVAPAVINRVRRGVTVTPDGMHYAAMGRGECVPRPYSLRAIAEFIPNTTEAWTWASALGLTTSVVGLYVMALSCTESPATALLSCALYGSLPYTRRLLVWPVLTDALSLGMLGLIGILSVSVSPVVALFATGLLIIAAQLIHERTSVHGALLAMWLLGSWWPLLPLFIAGVIYWIRYGGKPNIDTGIDYLQRPIHFAIQAHRKVGASFQSWILPWGGALAWMLSPSPELVGLFVASYLPCIASVDRVRTYQANPYPFVIMSIAALPLGWAALAVLVTHTIRDTEI